MTVFTVTVFPGSVQQMDDVVSAEPDAQRFRVEELSARSGAPVRTIREYQTWQILHPPTRIGRVGFYDDSHVHRLERIARLQARGYSIAAIRDLFEAWDQGADLRQVLGVDDEAELSADEAPIVVSDEQLSELLPEVAGSSRLRARAECVGLLVAHEGGWIARSPSLLYLMADSIGAGLSPSAALDLAEAVVAAATEAGRAAAVAVQLGARAGDDGAEALLRRGRVLIARAIATHTVDQTGRHLAAQADTDPRLAELVAQVRVGTVVTSRR